MLKKKFTFFVIAVSSLATLLSALVEASEILGYPKLDHPPPIKPEWLGLVNLNNAPKAPIKQKEAGTNVGICPSNDNGFCDWSCTNCINATVDHDRCLGNKVWGITYDDGPSEFTPAILDHLKAIGVKATFFIVGSRVVEKPEILARTVAEGHQVGIHTWSHSSLTTQTNEDIIAELKWTEQIIKQVTNFTPNFMRPPYGDIDDRVRHIVKSLGYKAVIWDLDTRDWMTDDKPPDYDENWIVGNFTMWVKDPTIAKTSHISLEHDLFPLSAKHAPEALDIVKAAGFQIEQVAACVNEPPYLELPGFPTNNTTTTTSSVPYATTTAKIQPTTYHPKPSTTFASGSSDSFSYSSSNIFFALAFVSIIFFTFSSPF